MVNGISMDFQQVHNHLPRRSVLGRGEVAGGHRHGTLDRVGRHRAHTSAISGDQARNQKTLIAEFTKLQETEHRDCLSTMSAMRYPWWIYKCSFWNNQDYNLITLYTCQNCGAVQWWKSNEDVQNLRIQLYVMSLDSVNLFALRIAFFVLQVWPVLAWAFVLGWYVSGGGWVGFCFKVTLIQAWTVQLCDTFIYQDN